MGANSFDARCAVRCQESCYYRPSKKGTAILTIAHCLGDSNTVANSKGCSKGVQF